MDGMKITTAPLLMLLVSLACASCALPPAGAATRSPAGVTVELLWLGADAAQLAREVAAPLEQQFTAIRGVSRVITHCRNGACTLLLEHDPEFHVQDIAFEANAVLRRADNLLPQGVRSVVLPYDSSRAPDIVIALIAAADEVTPAHYEDAHTFALNLMRLPGATQYEVIGMPVSETRVVIRRDRALAMGVTIDEIAEAIEQRVVTIDEHTRIIIRSPFDDDTVADTVVRKVGTQTITVRDVADIERVMTPGAVYHVDGEPAILINLFLRSDATADEVSACLARVIAMPRPETFKRTLPLTVRSR
jgi:multidrug efflux pump subunit AcrB